MLNRTAVLKLSRQLDRQQMKAYIEKGRGEPVTMAQFNRLMRELLPKESYYQSGIIRYLQQAYPEAVVWKAQAGPYSRQGIPDICAVIDGRFFGFEVKRPYIGRLSKIQEQTIQAIQRAGGCAGVVSWPEQAEELIRKAMNT